MILLVAALTLPPLAVCAQQRLTDAELRQRMIAESHIGYRGNCACPQFAASNGSRCGARSAYSKGRGLFCFPSDITQAMLDEYRRRNNIGRR